MASSLKSFEVPRSTSEAPGAFPLDASDFLPVGTSAPQSLSAAVRARKDEYTRKRSLKIKVGSWNVASLSGTEKDLGPWFVKGFGVKGMSDNMAKLQPESSTNLREDKNLESVEDQEKRQRKKQPTVPHHDTPAVPHDDEIGLYVLGLQEVVDISSVTEAMKPYTDHNPAKKWKTSLRSCLPPGYEKVAEQQLLGLLILVFASPELLPSVSNVSCTSVGTGLMGYLGNKGAVSVRIVLGESTKMCFVNCHLAAGADDTSLQRRIWDTNQILQRTRFAPVTLDGEEVGPEEKIGDEDFAFWFGDLNYRLDDIPGEDVRRLLLLHTRNEYDIINKSRLKIDSELGYISADSDTELSSVSEAATHYEFNDAEPPATYSDVDPPLDPKSDPASLLTTINSLLAHDQLHAQQRQKKVFHEGWREGEIHFLPTYKYDVGSVGMFDSGEKKRSPSWCDRILYRTRTDMLMYEERVAKEIQSRKRDEDMQKRGLDSAAAEQDVLFDYDPDTDGLAYGDEYDEDQDSMNDAELVETHEGHEDEIEVEHYVSHQRVLSSDHKPVECTFTITYDAVVPELKAKIHAEVARELDKAENEARPTITVVTENYNDNHSDAAGEASIDNITPTTSSEVNSINFGHLRYDVPKTRSITIANTGQLPATFSFVGRDAGADPSNNSAIAPTWLSISTIDPNSPGHGEYATAIKGYTLSPGDTHTLHLTAHVGASDARLVEQLNASTTNLDDVLILRIASGRDHFLPLRALWLPTCFHRSLDQLVVAPASGVRSMPRRPNNRDGTGTDGVKSSPTTNPGRNSAPRELFELTEAVQLMAERAMVDWEMVHPDETAPWLRDAGNGNPLGWPFVESSWTLQPGPERDDLKARVREALDTANAIQASFDTETTAIVRLEIVAETLILFLASVRGGIVTPDMWTSILSQLSQIEKDKTGSSKNGSVTSDDTLSTVMEVLGSKPVHSVSLTFVTFMLGRLMSEAAPLPKPKDGSKSSQQHEGEEVPASPSQTLSKRDSRASSLFSTSASASSDDPATMTTTTTTSSASTTDETEHSTDISPSPPPPPPSASARSKATTFLTSLTRRRRAASAASSSTPTATPGSGPGQFSDTTIAAAMEAAQRRRKALMTTYAGIFAPLVIRSGAASNASTTTVRTITSQTPKNGANVGDVAGATRAEKPEKVSEKERKALEAWKARVMLGILEASLFNV